MIKRPLTPAKSIFISRDDPLPDSHDPEEMTKHADPYTNVVMSPGLPHSHHRLVCRQKQVEFFGILPRAVSASQSRLAVRV